MVESGIARNNKFLVCCYVVGSWIAASYSGPYKMQKKGDITKKVLMNATFH